VIIKKIYGGNVFFDNNTIGTVMKLDCIIVSLNNLSLNTSMNCGSIEIADAMFNYYSKILTEYCDSLLDEYDKESVKFYHNDINGTLLDITITRHGNDICIETLPFKKQLPHVKEPKQLYCVSGEMHTLLPSNGDIVLSLDVIDCGYHQRYISRGVAMQYYEHYKSILSEYMETLNKLGNKQQ